MRVGKTAIKHFVFLRRLPDNPVWAGGEKRLLSYFREVDFSKFKITLVVSHDIFSEVFRKENLPVNVVVLKEYLALRSFKRFWTLFIKLRELRPGRLIYVQGGFWDFWVSDFLAGLIAAKGQLIDLHISSPREWLLLKTSKRHFGIFPGLGLWWYQQMWWSILRGRLAYKIIAVSRGAKRRMVEWFGYPANKIEVIHHGIRLTNFSPDTAVRKKMREQFGIPGDDTVIISTSRFSEGKRVDRILGAFENIHDEFPYTWLLFVGEGPLKTQLEDRAQRGGCKERIKFLGFQQQVLDFLRMSDIFVLSSDWEGLSNAMLEAMATGLVTVVTKVPGADDAIVDGENGFLAECSQEGMIEGLTRALRLPLKDREKIGNNAINSVHKNFDVRQGIKKMFHAIELG